MIKKHDFWTVVGCIIFCSIMAVIIRNILPEDNMGQLSFGVVVGLFFSACALLGSEYGKSKKEEEIRQQKQSGWYSRF